MADRRYYLTTPIYYVNDAPHIGHAYTTLACDVLARFMRLDGREVLFLTGTDEHGQKVEKSAAAAGMPPKAFTDKVSQNFRDLARDMKFSNDDFIRTTEPRHIRACQALWQRLIERDQIYLGKYAGWYAVRDEAYYAEDELTTGPSGKKIAPSGAEVEWVEEPSYFFRLSAWQDRLLAFYDANPDFVAPESRRNEVRSFVRGGLKDLSVSRTSFKWGVPVPNDPAHIMYVWLDALTNYITAAGFPDIESETYRKFWPADLHMVGKDILRFHAVYWPAFLMAADLAPPHRVFAHGWWTNEGQKISKSVGNIIDPLQLIERYGLDAVRYFLLREIPFGGDGDFSHRAMVNRMNGDLANDFGNLAQRVLSMINKNCGAVVPTPGPFTAADEAMLAAARAVYPKLAAEIGRQAFHVGLETIWQVIGAANRYVDEQAPWALRKTDPIRMGTVLYVVAEVVRRLAILAQPFMPDSCGRLLDQLAVPADQRQFAALDGMLTAGVSLPKPEGVFPRFVDPAAS
ncbi:MAG: methionyl-tRNA synthetase [Rhodospirillaceae bacterium]|jgi:methionyl-tRNA synthetase|nr:methionyl-tRNA synthetase [Rhodospirillaceae bacterium]